MRVRVKWWPCTLCCIFLHMKYENKTCKYFQSILYMMRKNMSLFVYHNGVDRDLKREIRKNLANRGHGHIN